jgi:hypothetical protein
MSGAARTVLTLGLMVGLVALGFGLSRLGQAPEQDVAMLEIHTPCAVIGEGCMAGDDEMAIGLRIAEPVQPLQPFAVEVEAGAVESVFVEFSMRDMDMGMNRYRLEPDAADGRWRAQVMLPVCSMGRRDWVARVETRTPQAAYAAEFEFETGGR